MHCSQVQLKTKVCLIFLQNLNTLTQAYHPLFKKYLGRVTKTALLSSTLHWYSDVALHIRGWSHHCCWENHNPVLSLDWKKPINMHFHDAQWCKIELHIGITWGSHAKLAGSSTQMTCVCTCGRANAYPDLLLSLCSPWPSGGTNGIIQDCSSSSSSSHRQNMITKLW